MPTHTKDRGTGIRIERCYRSDQEPFIAQLHQEKVKDYFINSPYKGLLLYQKLGSGKCMAIDTPIMLENGKLKMVQDIKIGDLLMGDDSTPRTVTSLARGEDEMYEIIPVKGDSYTVNQEHILCLKASGYPRINHANDRNNTNYNVQYIENNKFMSRTFRYKKNDKEDQKIKKEESEIFFNSISHDNIMEISVIEYLKLSKMKKACLKTYRVPVEFPEQKVVIDPYMIGYWLGNSNSQITKEHKELDSYFEKFCNDNNHMLYKTKKDFRYTVNGSGKGKSISNNLLGALKGNNLINNKYIPDIYKYNSRENRLKLLAGLIDSDGNLSKNCFEFSQTIEKEKLFEDVLYLARSLGFSCYKAKNKKGEVWKMNIRGSGIEQIPTKQKVGGKVLNQKDVLVSSIKVKHIGRDKYYGFTLDGNFRYLLGDFTVTHNTCTSIIIADEMIERKMVNHVYVCTPGSLRKNFTTEYCELCGKQENLKDNYTFITYNTNIYKSIQRLDFNNSLIIIDEAHNLINGVKNITMNSYALYNKILNSNAKVLLLTATVIYNNIYEWCLLGNLLKENTFPNIVESGELNTELFDKNIGKIFSKENLEGIISYYPGFDKDYPKVIYNTPIIVPMTISQSKEWNSISKKEFLRRKIGPPKPSEYRENRAQAQLKSIFYIMAQKYILSRAISNVHYLSFMIRRDLNEDEKEVVNYYMKHFFEKNKNKEEADKTDKTDKEESDKTDDLERIKQLIIRELHIMAPTFTDILNLNMSIKEILDYIENKLILKKLVSRQELDEYINVYKILKDELKRMEEKEEIIDDGGEEDIDFPYCKKCKESLHFHNIVDKKSYYKWALKNHPDKVTNVDKDNAEELFKTISSCYSDWENDSKCRNITGEILFRENKKEQFDENIPEYEEEVEVEIEVEEEEDFGILNICNICMQPLNRGHNLIYKLNCSDIFHYKCIKDYVKNIENIKDKKCPVCNLHIEGKINKSNAVPYNYKEVSDKFVEEGGWINKEIFQNKLLTVISPKILTILLNIIKNFNSKHVIFSFFLEKAGIRLISNILKMCGIKTVLYHGDLNPETRANILKKFNKKNNIYGEKIKVFLSTEAGFEGISLKEVGHVHLMETNTIPNKTLQAIGRAVRFKSHIRLPENKRVVNIWKYFSTPIDYIGKMDNFSTFDNNLNTFDEYYQYYNKGGFIEYLNNKYGENSIIYEVGTDEYLDSKSKYKTEEFNEFYSTLKENSIENTGMIDMFNINRKKVHIVEEEGYEESKEYEDLEEEGYEEGYEESKYLEEEGYEESKESKDLEEESDKEGDKKEIEEGEEIVDE